MNHPVVAYLALYLKPVINFALLCPLNKWHNFQKGIKWFLLLSIANFLSLNHRRSSNEVIKLSSQSSTAYSKLILDNKCIYKVSQKRTRKSSKERYHYEFLSSTFSLGHLECYPNPRPK